MTISKNYAFAFSGVKQTHYFRKQQFISLYLYCTYFFINRMYLYSSFQRSSDFLKQENDVKKFMMDLKKFLISLIRTTIVYYNIIYGGEEVGNFKLLFSCCFHDLLTS